MPGEKQISGAQLVARHFVLECMTLEALKILVAAMPEQQRKPFIEELAKRTVSDVRDATQHVEASRYAEECVAEFVKKVWQ